jgi:hypothetical protein
MIKRVLQALSVFLVFSLPGCGTNIAKLFETDSELAWQIEDAVRTAEDRNITAMNSYYDAETEKLQVCRTLYHDAEAQIDLGLSGGAVPIFEKFWGDLMLLGALLFPVSHVEDCARAIKRFELEYSALSDRLAGSEGAGIE